MREIEKAILSTAILYEDLRYLIFGELQEEHFTNEYRTIFKEMQKLYKQKQDIDPVIILTNLGQAYTDVIADLSDVGFVKPNIEQYIKILKDNYSSNMAIRETEELLLNLKKKQISPEDAQSKYIEISKYFNINDGKYKSYSMPEALSKAWDSYYARANFIRTGYGKIDRDVKISKGDYIIIGGRPSSGKSTFATNIMANMSRDNKVVFFSLETNIVNITNKIICLTGKIPLNKIMNKTLSEEEEKRFQETYNALMNSNLKIVEAAGMTVNQISTKALQEQADIIFVDHMSIVNSNAKSLYEKVSKISNELHEFAQREKITVFALSQLRRAEQGRKAQEPTMSDLRESGAIEQDADVVMILYDPVTALSNEEQAEQRKDISKQKRDLIIAKNKLGKTGKLYLNFYGGIQKFYES